MAHETPSQVPNSAWSLKNVLDESQVCFLKNAKYISTHVKLHEKQCMILVYTYAELS